jgi:hypothetical protein
MVENELIIRQVLRIYRNAIVAFIRAKLLAQLGSQATTELGRLFAKVDPNTGKTQWEGMRLNAERARAAPEVAALLIRDPKSNLDVVRIYQWHRDSNEGDWKRRGIIALDRSEQVRELIGALQSFAHNLAEAQLTKLQQKTAKRARAVLEK